MSTVPPATSRRRAPGTGAVAVDSTPSPRSASSSGAIGRARACSSPSNSTSPTRPVPPAAGRTATPCRPGRSRLRASGARGDRPADRQFVVRSVDPHTQRFQRTDHQVGVAAAQRPADGRDAAGGRRQRRQHQRPVGLRFRAGNRHRRVYRPRRGGGGPDTHVFHHGPPAKPGAAGRRSRSRRHHGTCVDGSR